MTFKPGEVSNPNGRPVGSENRLTRKAKYHAERLFDEFKKIGFDKLVESGDIKDLIALIGKFTPREIKAEIDGNMTNTLTFEKVASKEKSE